MTEKGIVFPYNAEDGITITGIKDSKLFLAVTVAVAGKHHIIAWGAPGCGKTTALRSMAEIMPLPTEQELAEIRAVYGEANYPYVPSAAPFRMPHQAASIEGMCGGGVHCRPGEISLAHNGVLFLDEAAEFRSAVLSMLRAPLESHCIRISRAGKEKVFPANFQLAMAVGACPCGCYGSGKRLCLCSGSAVRNYWRKFTVPLIDRIGIRVFVSGDGDFVAPPLESVRSSVAAAITVQRERGKYNQYITPNDIDNWCTLTGNGSRTYDRLLSVKDYSRGKLHNILRVARTLADMETEHDIDGRHITQAVALCEEIPMEKTVL